MRALLRDGTAPGGVRATSGAAKGCTGRSRRLYAAVGPWGARLPCAARAPGPLTTRFTRCARFAQTVFASQFAKRASTRAARSLALLGAAYARRALPAQPFAEPAEAFIDEHHHRFSKAASGVGVCILGCTQRAVPARPRAGARRGAHAAPSSAGSGSARVLARFVKLTREHCLSETSAASEASCERDPDPSSAGESGSEASRPPHLRHAGLPPVALLAQTSGRFGDHRQATP